jgi:predicted O-linked N-acetylglucosamine transferase (SPINDLY family)
VFHLGSTEDEDTLFARSRASHFEQGKRSLLQWVRAIVGQCPDVLIYPEMGMDAMTVKLASMRLAPVQVVTWGHPETTGLPTLDYFLSAEDMEPARAQENYTERLVRLPHLGCFYSPPDIVASEPDLDALGIGTGHPILLCPGVPFKYAPEHDKVFPEIVRRLGRCRLVFFSHRVHSLSEKLARRLRVVFAHADLDMDEYVRFIPWQSRRSFYGLMKRADVFLDTIGFSGFNTAIQAIECGLPVVTREGRFLRGRLASGILKRMGLHELVAATEDEYAALAAKICRDAPYRARIRERIEQSRGVLFEDEAPIRAMEEFLVEAVGQAR